jgi:hypothetical protein
MTDDTATIERDLTAVETALASGTATHADATARELQELALALRADAPRPDPEFAERLEGRVSAGFSREARAVRRARRPALGRLRPRDFAPLGGLAAVLLVMVSVLVVAGGDGSGDRDSAGGASEALTDSGAGGGGAAESSGDDGGSVAPAEQRAGGGFAPEQPNRRIERSFTLELEVPTEEMARVANEVTAVTNRHGGFVLSSSVVSGEGDSGGNFSLRIPADRVRPALRDLAALAPVLRQTQEGRDVTRQHVTATDRLQAARAERRSLLRRLEAAATDEEAEALRRQLDLVAGEINGLRAQLRDLRLRTNYAVVDVSLLAGDDGSSGASGGGSLDDAIDDAGGLLVGLAGVLVRVLALAIPLGLIALVAWLVTRAARRRRRESALS